MAYFVLPRSKYAEAQKRLNIIRNSTHTIRTETELQTEQLIKMAADVTDKLRDGHRYGIFEVHDNCTAIRNGVQIPHSTEVYITVWTWHQELGQLSCESAWGGTAFKRPHDGMLLFEL